MNMGKMMSANRLSSRMSCTDLWIRVAETI